MTFLSGLRRKLGSVKMENVLIIVAYRIHFLQFAVSTMLWLQLCHCTENIPYSCCTAAGRKGMVAAPAI